MIAQIFAANAELVIPTGTQTNEENAEIETQLVNVEDRISNFSTKFRYLHASYIFHPLNHYFLFHLKVNLLLHQFFLI